MFEFEKQELVRICKLLYDRNLVTACDGNVSCKTTDGHILITPSGKNKGFIEASEILVLNFNGEVIDGEGKASKEFPLHKNIYLSRKDVNAVVHSHPVYATAFAVAGKTVPDNLLIESRVLLGGCALAEYAKPGSIELGEAIKPFIADNNAILLKNHGAITYGIDLMDAFNKMEIFESIAKTIIMAKIIGEPCEIPFSELEKL